nr:hypothetical protein [uncultured Massilia sp.]
MKSLVHVILVWLLLLALPIQGVAAAGMLPCVPAAPAATKQAAHAPMDASTATAGHDHAAMTAKAAGADAHCTPQQPDAPSGCHDAGDRHGKGSCASCCVGCAMAPAALPLPLALASPDSISIPFRAGHVPSVDPTLLERPPRTRFA